MNVCMPNTVTSKLLFKSQTAIGFYVKTMSAHDSHHGWRSWSLDTTLKVYYPKTIHAMFELISVPVGPYGKKCFKIFSSETSKPI
jgi:hypothetical protein